MEGTSFPMCVQVSEQTRDAAVAQGVSAERFAALGLRPIKGKGDMATHLLKAGAWEGALASLGGA